MNISGSIATLIGQQYQCPTGFIGRFIGEKMVRQHVPETTWTIDLLQIQPADQVLEIGFGAGKAIERIAARITQGHITGIDLSQTMVRSASQRNKQYIKAGLVTLQQGDIAALPFAEAQFDKILSIQTFYFWRDPAQVMTDILRILKPGGTVAITLSTGRIDQPTNLPFQAQIEEQVLPHMQHIGFADARIEEGPHSRQFNTVTILGRK